MPQTDVGDLHVEMGRAKLARGRPSLEGDGWVNWSGLATLLAELASALTAPANRLLHPPVGTMLEPPD